MKTLSEAGARSEITNTVVHRVYFMVIEFLDGCAHALSEIFNLVLLDKSKISRHLPLLREAVLTSSQKTGRNDLFAHKTQIGERRGMILICNV